MKWLQNWRTTLLGIGQVLGGTAMLINVVLKGEAEGVSITIALGMMSGGVALLAAADAANGG